MTSTCQQLVPFWGITTAMVSKFIVYAPTLMDNCLKWVLIDFRCHRAAKIRALIAAFVKRFLEQILHAIANKVLKENDVRMSLQKQNQVRKMKLILHFYSIQNISEKNLLLTVILKTRQNCILKKMKKPWHVSKQDSLVVLQMTNYNLLKNTN